MLTFSPNNLFITNTTKFQADFDLGCGGPIFELPIRFPAINIGAVNRDVVNNEDFIIHIALSSAVASNLDALDLLSPCEILPLFQQINLI